MKETLTTGAWFIGTATRADMSRCQHCGLARRLYPLYTRASVFMPEPEPATVCEDCLVLLTDVEECHE